MSATDDSNDPDPAAMIDRMAEDYAAKLAEHCESVVIITTFSKPATGPEGPRTGLVAAARGNYYAQQGSVTAWLEGNPEFDQPPAPPKRPTDDGDEWKGADA